MTLNNAHKFFEFARKREQIRLDREEGKPAPWTDDEVLQTYRFCNVFREDDRVTRWFREEVRKPRFVFKNVVWSTLVFRWFNTIHAGKVMLPWLLRPQDYLRSAMEAELRVAAQRAPLFTGAYMIKSPSGMDKITGILNCVDEAAPVLEEIEQFSHGCYIHTLEETHERLMKIPYLGRFMAYEVVTDLAHTAILRDVRDTMTWASAGPGAARGVGWVVKGQPDGYSYTSQSGQQFLLQVMKELLDLSQDPAHWPEDWPAWTMREVEHTLCEFDKYRRALAGQSLKRKFKPCTT